MSRYQIVITISTIPLLTFGSVHSTRGVESDRLLTQNHATLGLALNKMHASNTSACKDFHSQGTHFPEKFWACLMILFDSQVNWKMCEWLWNTCFWTYLMGFSNSTSRMSCFTVLDCTIVETNNTIVLNHSFLTLCQNRSCLLLIYQCTRCCCSSPSRLMVGGLSDSRTFLPIANDS